MNKIADFNRKSHFIVIVGEGVDIIFKISKHFGIAVNIQAETGIDTRSLVFQNL